MVTRGFTGRNSGGDQTDRVPPGQHLVEHFPVLTAGPTPRVETANWKFTLKVGPRPVKAWNWSEFNALPKTKMTRDIHCVTSWSKLDTAWEGVIVDDILADAGVERPTDFVLAHCYDGYSTNVPLADLASGKAMVALNYEGQPLPRDHRSEEHTSELQSLMRISYAVFCLKKKKTNTKTKQNKLRLHNKIPVTMITCHTKHYIIPHQNPYSI